MIAKKKLSAIIENLILKILKCIICLSLANITSYISGNENVVPFCGIKTVVLHTMIYFGNEAIP